MTWVRKLRRVGIQGLLVLLAVSLLMVITAVYQRSKKPGNDEAAHSRRQSALLQASELLVAPAVVTYMPRRQLIQQAQYQYSPADPGAVPKREMLGASPEKTPLAEASRTARPSGPPAPTATASTPAPPAAAAPASQPPRRQIRKSIPSSIEDGLPAATAGDALSGITISSATRGPDDAAHQESATVTRGKSRTADLPH